MALELEVRWQGAGGRGQGGGSSRRGFTLTELLIVIAIIAVLASLIVAAAVNALRAAKRGRISLEIKNISASIEEFKNDYGDYPPNGMNPAAPVATPPVNSPARLVKADFERMFKKAFPRSQEPITLVRALCGTNAGAPAEENLLNGMRANEALYFWLGGFSEDPQYPISGPGGPSYPVNGQEILESRNRRYEFDPGRLAPKTSDGFFDLTKGRQLRYRVDLNGNGSIDSDETRAINMWYYLPSGSEQPLVYFDTSRYKPGLAADGRYDLWAAEPTSTGVPWIVAFKQLRQGVSQVNSVSDLVFVNQGKFQVIHAGLDDDWDSEKMQAMSAAFNAPNYGNVLLYPKGPFIGPISDTLTNFTDGTVEDATQ